MYIEKKSVKGPRIGAAIIDNIIFYMINSLLSLIILIATNFNFIFSNNFQNYKLTTLYTFLTNLLGLFIFYTVIPYLLKGKTIGKALVGVKVTSIDYKEPTFIQLLIRNIFFFETLLIQGFSLILLFLSSGNPYYNTNLGLNFIFSIIIFLINISILIMIITTPDERGFHDMIARTYVVHKNFDYDRLTQINALERQNMQWADFDDVGDTINILNEETNEDSDNIEILNDKQE